MDLPQWLNSNPLLAAVRTENICEFIDTSGKSAPLGQFQYTDNFSNGLACINEGGNRIQEPPGVIGGNFRFLATDGSTLPLRFDEPSYFSCERAIIKYGTLAKIVDTTGETIAEGFEGIFPFHTGLAAASKLNAIGYVNVEGEWEFQMKSGDIINNFQDGIAKIIRNSQNGFVNPTGQWLIEPTDLEILPFSERLAGYFENGKYGFLNDEGDKIIAADFDNVTHFKEGLAGVTINDKWGFINANGDLVIEPSFDNVRTFSEGLAAVMKNGKVGYINTKGKLTIKPQFSAAYDFKNGYAVAQEKGKLGYIDEKGKWKISPVFDRANHFVSPLEDNPFLRIN
ncbi:WG repeat-containing protein [Portibacter lacus]|uniref:WG repeat-containing protein n=1 Tax=Portibacter lacus TaxID=1099794 RepID=A0AA37SP95_9BACT|nr:WG repeat-containing protein [Portibacter lacus]GLR16689.1 hypothetical protein GCM10007940_13040 [Portibacter lacus]